MVSRNHRAGTIALSIMSTGTGTGTITLAITGTGTGKPGGQNQAMQTRDSLVAGDRRKLQIQSDCRQERIAV